MTITAIPRPESILLIGKRAAADRQLLIGDGLTLQVHDVPDIETATHLVTRQSISVVVIDLDDAVGAAVAALRKSGIALPVVGVIDVDDDVAAHHIRKAGAQALIGRWAFTGDAVREAVDLALHRHAAEGLLERLDGLGGAYPNPQTTTAGASIDGLMAEFESGQRALRETLAALDTSEHLEHTYYDLKVQLIRRAQALADFTRLRAAIVSRQPHDATAESGFMSDLGKEAAHARQALIVLQGENSELRDRLTVQERDIHRLRQVPVQSEDSGAALRAAQQHYYAELQRLQSELAEARAARTRLEEALTVAQRQQTTQLVADWDRDTTPLHPMVAKLSQCDRGVADGEIDDRLHEVEGVLAQVGETAASISSLLRNSRLSDLGWAETLVRTHAQDFAALAAENTAENTAEHLPVVLARMARAWNQEQSTMLEEMATLSGRVERIRSLIHGSPTPLTVVP